MRSTSAWQCFMVMPLQTVDREGRWLLVLPRMGSRLRCRASCGLGVGVAAAAAAATGDHGVCPSMRCAGCLSLHFITKGSRLGCGRGVGKTRSGILWRGGARMLAVLGWMDGWMDACLPALGAAGAAALRAMHVILRFSKAQDLARDSWLCFTLFTNSYFRRSVRCSLPVLVLMVAWWTCAWRGNRKGPAPVATGELLPSTVQYSAAAWGGDACPSSSRRRWGE